MPKYDVTISSTQWDIEAVDEFDAQQQAVANLDDIDINVELSDDQDEEEEEDEAESD